MFFFFNDWVTDVLASCLLFVVVVVVVVAVVVVDLVVFALI